MGYKLTSLVHLPLDESVQMYIFAIGDSLWAGGLWELVHKNFDNIARDIGPYSIIVGALGAEFHGEVVEKYLGRSHYELKNQLPALLITDSHPDCLTKDSLRVLIPLRAAHEQYALIDDFLADVAAFARRENDNLLKQLDSGSKGIQIADDIVKLNFPVVPGVLGVNLNNAVKHLHAWWNREKVVLPPLEGGKNT